MSIFEFELRKFSNRKEIGCKGIAGTFGDVLTARQEISIKESRRRGNRSEVVLRGEQLPELLFRGTGPGRPTLETPHLLIEGISIELDFSKRAFRRKSRALHLTHEGRTWTYVVIHPNRSSVLERPGVQIPLDRRKSSTGKGASSYVTATREAAAIDLALAIIFKEVQTYALTSGGAISSVLNRIVTPRHGYSNEAIPLD
ncbi:hypothetical protein ACFWOJ_21750 [Streptomyces sp. NPDC058439]|uniref:hypothetical protein n=1 Tax=Streptomyces sp. NPDC058439 TaxID=3346500 RepID=UPI003647B82C